MSRVRKLAIRGATHWRYYLVALALFLAGGWLIRVQSTRWKRSAQLAPYSAHQFDPVGRLRGFENTPLPYLLYQPEIPENRTVPLVVVLHGAGDCGSDLLGPRRFVDDFLIKPSQHERYPCYISVPQCPVGGSWETLSHGFAAEVIDQWIDDLIQKYAIDAGRIYLIGASMGGFGAWYLASELPDRFASVVAIAGGGQLHSASRLVKIPIWAIHGEDDSLVQLVESQRMVSAVNDLGGSAKLSVLAGIGHESWDVVKSDPDAYLKWMFRIRQVRH